MSNITLICPGCGNPMYSPSHRDQTCNCGSVNQVMRYLQVVLNSMKRLPRFFIPLPDGVSPYLERFILKRYADGSCDYLHIIWESDGDRDPHDHPFDFESTIVWGSYSERSYNFYCRNLNCRRIQDIHGPCHECGGAMSMNTNMETFKAGDKNKKRAAQLHRLTIIEGPVVTLVKRGPKKREWGFETDKGWVHHKPYIAEKFPGAQPTEVD